MPIPVSLDDAKHHLRHAGEDLDVERQAEIEGFIADAVEWVEGYTGHILVAREVTEQFDGFSRLQLKAWPVKPEATVTMVYEGMAGETTAISGARIFTVRRPAMIIAAAGTRWPSGVASTVSVALRAGYEPGDTVPGNIRRAMLILIAAYDGDREGGDLFVKAEETARSLCDRANLRLRRL